MIRLLNPSEVQQLDHIFREEWDAYVPTEHAEMLAEVDDGELVAFIPLEDVILLGGAYVAPNCRGAQGTRALLRLVNHLKRSAEKSGRSFIMARHEDRAGHFAGLSEKLGFRKFADVVYRTDRFRRD